MLHDPGSLHGAVSLQGASSLHDTAGRMTPFAARHRLRDANGVGATARMLTRVRERGLHSVRFVFVDQHGLTRGKTVAAAGVRSALDEGVAITTTLLAKDTSHQTAFPVFTAGGGFGMAAMQGAADMRMIADAATFTELPWAPGTGWVLCDLYFDDGSPVPFSTRQLLRGILDGAAADGLRPWFGLEVELHLFRLLDPRLAAGDAAAIGRPAPPPEVALLHAGYQYLTELRYDQIEPALELLRAPLAEMGLPLRSLELEFGPSQCEFTFEPRDGMAAADLMVLFRTAVKQIARRHGYHATFMCRPAIPNMMPSGWHLHQSLQDAVTGDNRFAVDGSGARRRDAWSSGGGSSDSGSNDDGSPPDERVPLSATGRHYLAGLLEHAAAGLAFATPTINGYRRFRANSLAPDRINWAVDNRGAMLRVLGAGNPAAVRIENRIGEPAANPYLYIGAQVLAGTDGLRRRLEPPAPTDSPYQDDAPRLPTTLPAALAALSQSALLRRGFGDAFVDCFLRIKQHELARFEAETTAWEQREYFDLF
ncbi:MAG: glutamine synthetase family protein [Lautropia sp.]